MSVLFCDIAGSYTFLYDSDPEQGKLIIDMAITEMISVIERYGGVINQIQGDGVMSLFGAPQAIEDHAYRACQAASALVELFKLNNAGGAWPDGNSIEIRIGISTGEAVVGIQSVRHPLGGKRHEYFAAGAVSHLAGRLQKLASAFEIVISQNTADAIGSAASTSPVVNRSVHELIDSHPQPFRLTGIGGSCDSTQAHPETSRFVGRQQEMNEIYAALVELDKLKKSCVVIVTGDPGIGKTRLLNEVVTGGSCTDWRIITASASSIEANSPFAVLRRLLFAWLGLPEGAPADYQRSELIRACKDIAPVNWVFVQSLAEVLDIATLDQRWTKLEPDIRRNEIYLAVLLLFSYWGTKRTLCIVEDLQWIDPASLHILESVLRDSGLGQIVFILSARDTTNLQQIEPLLHIELGSLPCEESRELFDSVSNTLQLEEYAVENLLNRCGGVPLFIEQIAFSGDGQLDAVMLTTNQSEFSVNPFIRSLIGSRIDQLTPQAKHVLGISSIAGARFNFGSLLAVMGLAEADLQSCLGILVEQRLIKPISGFQEYSFTHALYQEVAYLGLLKGQLQPQHRAFLDYFKQLEATRQDSTLSEQVHHHAWRGQVWPDVVKYSSEAAREASDKGAYREAMHFLEQGLLAHDYLSEESEGESEKLQAQKAVTLLELSRTCIPCGDIERSYKALDECQAISRLLQNDHIYCESFAYRTALLAVQADAATSVASGENAVSAAKSASSDRLLYGCTVYLAEAVFFNGDFRRVTRLLQPLIDTAVVDRYPLDRIGNTAPASIDCYGIHGMAYAQLGQFDLAERYGNFACEIADSTGKSFDRGLAYFYISYILVHRCKMEEAEEHLERLMAIIDAGGVQFLSPWFRGLLGFVYARQGALDQARVLVDRSIIDAKNMSLTIFELYAQVSLAFVQTEAKQFTDASTTLACAEKMAREGNFNSVKMWIERSQGALCIASDHVNEGVRLLKTAIKSGEELGMLPDVAHCHAMIAAALEQADGVDSNQQSSAQEHHNIAQRMYNELGINI